MCCKRQGSGKWTEEAIVRAGLTSDGFQLHFRVMVDRSRGATEHVRAYLGGQWGVTGTYLQAQAGVCGVDGTESLSTQHAPKRLNKGMVEDSNKYDNIGVEGSE